MRKATILAFAVVFSACLLPALPAQAAPPAISDLVGLSVETRLGAAASQTVEDYVKHWVEFVKRAKTVEDVEKGRKSLLNGYQVHATVHYQFEYAKRFSGHAPSVLTLPDDPLKVIKEINISMIAEAMSQISIQPMLEAMAGHPNAAVRYWAARSYRSAGRLLLMQRTQQTKTMLATLEAMGLKEPSGNVLAMVLIALGPYRDVEGKPARDLRIALDKVWHARANKDLQAGVPDVADCFLKALPLIARVEAQDKKLAVQLLADVLDAASLALLKAPNKADEELVRTLTNLLREVESRLSRLLETDQSAIQKILSDEKKDLTVKAAEIRLKVNDVWKPLLEAQGAKTRVAPPPPPAPATKPAAAKAGG